MCWALRSFLRYLHYKGLNPHPLAGCVPSIRRWKLASLPTYLSAVQVQTVLDGCDRATPLGRRDYAILMMLAKLGMRASEVATLTLDDIDWRSGGVLIRSKGRQRGRMPIPATVGAAVVAYLRDGQPEVVVSPTISPHTGSPRRLCVWLRDHDDRQDCVRSRRHPRLRATGAHLFQHSLAAAAPIRRNLGGCVPSSST